MPVVRKRRELLLQTASGCLSVLLPGCGRLQRVPADLVEGRLIIPATALADQVCVAAAHPRLAAPVAVCRKGDALHAVIARCTHKQCDLRLGGDRFVCPCHGSEFALDGTVLQKPATRDLERIPVRQKGNIIQIGASHDS